MAQVAAEAKLIYLKDTICDIKFVGYYSKVVTTSRPVLDQFIKYAGHYNKGKEIEYSGLSISF